MLEYTQERLRTFFLFADFDILLHIGNLAYFRYEDIRHQDLCPHCGIFFLPNKTIYRHMFFFLKPLPIRAIIIKQPGALRGLVFWGGLLTELRDYNLIRA